MKLPDAYTLARNLMDHHGLAIRDRWQFEWMDSHRMFGQCQMQFVGKDMLWGKIRLSIQLVGLNSKDRVRKTILHEIAHAKANLAKGGNAGHSLWWEIEARKLGIKAERCYSEANTVTPPARYIGTCPAGHEYKRMRLTKGTKSCGICSPVFNSDHIVAYKLNPEFCG